ncbi:hypothetical protein BJ912DRAFT_544040 [Pholiota molesta]|nr:hypothetical protein BJ912DRAFT_544040 [Pholiota molesta]
MNMDLQLSLNDSNSVEKSDRLINDAVSRHTAAIVALKVQQNALAPVSRLPPEILCRIFTMVKTQVQTYSFRKAPAFLKWIEVTHVSSHWRRVAINFLNLWVDLPLKISDGSKKCFKDPNMPGLSSKLISVRNQYTLQLQDLSSL